MSGVDGNRRMLRRAVVLGGGGAVGGMFVDLLALSGLQVVAVDKLIPKRVRPEVTVLTIDVQRLEAEGSAAVASADLVLLALPEPVALAVGRTLASKMVPGALLVHTLSVQSRMRDLLIDQEHIEVLGLCPLFGPSLGLAGHGVAAVPVHEGPRGLELLALLADAGAGIVPLNADQHDRLMAAAQVLTHAAVLTFGLAMRELDVDADVLGPLAPPPHRALLALLARIAGGTVEVYWDIQAANPYAERARAALRSSMDSLSTAVLSGGEAAFDRLLRDAASVLGDDLGAYREASNTLLQSFEPWTATSPVRMPH